MRWRVPILQHEQRGAALLIFMLFSFLIGTSWFLSQVNTESARRHLDDVTASGMAEAKTALIGRAAQDDNRPGSLTCPDTDNDGVANQIGGNCTAYVGRLPWKTLDLPDLRDGHGERLWYALTPELRDNPGAQPINPQQVWTLTLNGAGNVAAVLLSAGPPLASQNGRPSFDVNDYLDEANKDGGPNYISKPTSPSFNDRIIAISRDQLFRIVNRGVLGQLAGDLEKYYIANANLYPENGTDLKTALDALAITLTSEPNEKMLLENRIEALDKNGWFAITNYMPASDKKSATLTISVPPAITCTIAPATKPVCTQP